MSATDATNFARRTAERKAQNEAHLRDRWTELHPRIQKQTREMMARYVQLAADGEIGWTREGLEIAGHLEAMRLPIWRLPHAEARAFLASL